MEKKRGQSILEYVIVLTAIVAALVWAAATLIMPKVKAGIGGETSSGAQKAVENVADQLSKIK